MAREAGGVLIWPAAPVEQLEHALGRTGEHGALAPLDDRALEELGALDEQGDQLVVAQLALSTRVGRDEARSCCRYGNAYTSWSTRWSSLRARPSPMSGASATLAPSLGAPYLLPATVRGLRLTAECRSYPPARPA